MLTLSSYKTFVWKVMIPVQLNSMLKFSMVKGEARELLKPILEEKVRAFYFDVTANREHPNRIEDILNMSSLISFSVLLTNTIFNLLPTYINLVGVLFIIAFLYLIKKGVNDICYSPEVGGDFSRLLLSWRFLNALIYLSYFLFSSIFIVESGLSLIAAIISLVVNSATIVYVHTRWVLEILDQPMDDKMMFEMFRVMKDHVPHDLKKGMLLDDIELGRRRENLSLSLLTLKIGFASKKSETPET